LEIGSTTNNKNLVVNGDTSTTSITMTTPDEIATGTNRDVNIMVHDGNTGGDNKLKILGSNKLTYNPDAAGTLSCPSLKLTGTGTDNSSNDRSLMFLNGSNKIVKSLDDLTFNNFTKTFKVSNIETDDIKTVLSTVASGGSSIDMPLLFQNPSSLSIKKVDLTTANGSYNASQDKFKMTNLEIINTLDFNNSIDASINFTSSLPTPGPGETNAHTIPFIDSYNSTTTQRKMKHTVGFSYTPSDQQLKCPNLLVTDKITVDDSLHYGTGATTQPLNYTFRIGHTDDINTVNIAGGTNHGSWGGGNVLSILKSGCKATSYGQNSKLWTFNAYNISSSTPTSFTMTGLPGLWHIIVTVNYMTSASGSSNRVNPILEALLNGSTTISEGAQSSYIRHQLGRVGTVKWENKLYFDTNDTIAFRTYANYSSVTGFSYILSSSNYTATKFMFMASYLGPLDEYDQSEP